MTIESSFSRRLDRSEASWSSMDFLASSLGVSLGGCCTCSPGLKGEAGATKVGGAITTTGLRSTFLFFSFSSFFCLSSYFCSSAEIKIGLAAIGLGRGVEPARFFPLTVSNIDGDAVFA